MGFMLRIILGLALVLSSCFLAEPASSWRHIRQAIPEEAPEVPVNQDKPNLTESNKEELINNVINRTIVNNVNGDIKRFENKPKTENETEKEDKQANNSKLNKEAEEYEYSNEDETEAIQSKQNSTKNTVSPREDGARSVDINKYISPQFHNKNDVYTLAISPDTEKYTNLHNDITFSTTSTYDFDKKQKDIEREVKDKLEYIEGEFAQTTRDFHDTKYDGENLEVSELLENSKNNDTDTDLQYVKYKNITSNFSKVKNRVNKETDAEAGQTVSFSSSHNKTHSYDDTPKDYKNKISSHSEELDGKFAHKFITEAVDVKKTLPDKADDGASLTKPLSLNKTASQDHLISNKIETDATNLDNSLKTKTNFLYTSSHIPILLPATTVPTTTKATTWTTPNTFPYINEGEKETTITLAKRGSTKYIDTISVGSTMSTIPRTRHPHIKFTNKQNLANKQNHTFEEVVQENQVYPVQVTAPSTEKSVTEEYSIFTTSADDVTSTLSMETTANLETTTETITTTIIPTTTEAERFSTNADLEAFTISTVEATTETSSEVYDVNSTTDINDTTEFATDSYTSVTDINRLNNGRGFNFTEDTDTTETIVITSTNASSSSSEKMIVTTITYNATTTEGIPTTNDYKENVILKQTDSLTTPKQLSTIQTTPHHKAKQFENKGTVSPYNTTEPSTRLYEKTTDAPLLISLNISMYETEPEITTSGHFVDNSDETSSGKIAAIVISSIGAVCLILLAGLLIVMRKRHKRFNYGQRCTPVSLDAYSVDNVSVYNSMRRKGALRASKRSYGNPAFEDPTCTSNPLNFPALAKFSSNANAIATEFEEVPQVTAQTNELPEGCETKNRYANVIPLPETRVFLNTIDGYPNSDYINANYVTGPKSTKNYYIACQAPMQNTVEDFWRMVWEQQTKVILMLTHLFENGGEKCIDYLPPSEVLDCHRLFGDFQITLKKREVKEKYVISILQLKNMVSNSWREVTHLWYLGWPEKGVPSEANSLIAFLIEARSYIKVLPPSENGKSNNNTNDHVANGSISVAHNPIVVHCSPGTGRTGTVIACDIAIREFELSRQIDIPKTVYRIRRDRASSVQTKDQYAFIYNVITLYATKLTGGVLDSL